MKLELKTPLKTFKGDTRKYLIVRPMMKVKDVKEARDLATKDGKQDAFEFNCHLMAKMVEDFTYEDVLEMDVVDHDALDKVIAEIQSPSSEKGTEDPKASTAPNSSTKSSKT